MASRFTVDRPTWEIGPSATLDVVKMVTRVVLDKLFSTKELEYLHGQPDEFCDFTFENPILYNCNALFYIEFVHAIKHGNIESVHNVLSVWMVIMCDVSMMPWYADAIFEMLGHLKVYDPVLQYAQIWLSRIPLWQWTSPGRETILDNWLVNLTGRSDGFKEVDLLQEHQNFWAKVIYNAKGTNHSWQWPLMITVCIWTLRDAIHTVHKAFSILGYGTWHTNPNNTLEVKAISNALEAEKIQSYPWPTRKSTCLTSAGFDLKWSSVFKWKKDLS